MTLLMSACQTPTGESLGANVYKSDQVNQKQEAKTVNILAVVSAKIEVDNTESQKTTQLLGGAIGGLGGALLGNKISDKYDKEGAVIGGVGGAVAGASIGNALVQNKVLVDAVTITYVEDGKTLSSTQVGQLCEFVVGNALVISTAVNETRIQPNASCPVVAEKG